MFLRGCTRRSSTVFAKCLNEFLLVRISRGRTIPRCAGASVGRYLSSTRNISAAADSSTNHDFLDRYKDSFRANHLSDSFHLGNPQSNEQNIGKTVTIHGFLGKRKDLSENLSFAQLILAGGKVGLGVQIVSRLHDGASTEPAASLEVHGKLKSIKAQSAVSVSGVLSLKRQPNGKRVALDDSERFSAKNIELVLQDITCLGAFPEDIIVSDEVQFGPESRHLQLRFDLDLNRRLKFRDRVLRETRNALEDFQEIETPILFKSTPEGAREFLVPTRRPGHAYALPQSPQQYKQILMASGVHRYFQIARCFRDEDLRADRQPEFTQVDLEMAFSDGQAVMTRVESFISILFQRLQQEGLVVSPPRPPFIRMKYHDAMQKYGSDKPDLRIKGSVKQVDSILSTDLIGMLTSLPNPIIDSWKIRLNTDPATVRSFVQDFMDSAEAIQFQKNPDGAPGIFVYDPRKPLEGLQAFGFEGTEALKTVYTPQGGPTSSNLVSDSLDMEPFAGGDLIFLQARPRSPLLGGSTALGRLRTSIHRAALSKGLIRRDKEDHFLWITDFPLFTPNNEMDPGQGGSSGFSATHHPFTAPKTAADVDLLLENPLEVIADHYDLVVNGVELGGGSRRIHDSEMQQFVMRHILKMSEERLKDFSHLFEVLRAGCPPHAGIALGLDRLIAVMLGVDSVRDVIAFPKSGKGEDLLVKSPSPMTIEQQETYHIKVFN